MKIERKQGEKTKKNRKKKKGRRTTQQKDYKRNKKYRMKTWKMDKNEKT